MDQLGTLTGLLPLLKHYRDRPAIVVFARQSTETWTYEKLAEEAEGLASDLTAAGIEKGDAVALWAEPGPAWMAVCLGAFSCGAVVVPLDVQLSDDTLLHALADSGAKVLFTTGRLFRRWKRLKKRPRVETILLDEPAKGAVDWRRLADEPAEADATVLPDDRAVLFYTSGTTGPPKGVPLTHRNLAFQINTMLAADLVSADDRILLPLPLHHVYPFTIGMLTPLALGVPIVFPYNLTGPQLVRALKEADVTMMIGVPRLYRALATGIESRVGSAGRVAGAVFRTALALSTALARGRIRIGRLLFRRLHREMGPRLRVVATGGAPIDPDLARKLEGLGWLVTTGYGLTETSPLLTIDKPGRARIAVSDDRSKGSKSASTRTPSTTGRKTGRRIKRTAEPDSDAWSGGCDLGPAKERSSPAGRACSPATTICPTRPRRRSPRTDGSVPAIWATSTRTGSSSSPVASRR